MSSFSWLSRLRSSSSRLTYNAFKNSLSQRQSLQSSIPRERIITSENTHSFFSWTASFLPLALALSAGSLALHSQTNQSFSLSEAPSIDPRYFTSVYWIKKWFLYHFLRNWGKNVVWSIEMSWVFLNGLWMIGLFSNMVLVSLFGALKCENWWQRQYRLCGERFL